MSYKYTRSPYRKNVLRVLIKHRVVTYIEYTGKRRPLPKIDIKIIIDIIRTNLIEERENMPLMICLFYAGDGQKRKTRLADLKPMYDFLRKELLKVRLVM